MKPLQIEFESNTVPHAFQKYNVYLVERNGEPAIVFETIGGSKTAGVWNYNDYQTACKLLNLDLKDITVLTKSDTSEEIIFTDEYFKTMPQNPLLFPF